METNDKPEAAGKDEAKLMEMVNTVNSMMRPLLMQISLERHATAAMQAMLQGDESMVHDIPKLVRCAWDIAEVMHQEYAGRVQKEMQAVLRDLEQGAAGFNAPAGGRVQ